MTKRKRCAVCDRLTEAWLTIAAMRGMGGHDIDAIPCCDGGCAEMAAEAAMVAIEALRDAKKARR